MTNEARLDTKSFLWFSAGVLLAMFAVAAYVWLQLPAGAEVCTQWDEAGGCAQSSSKVVTVMVIPLLGLLIATIFALIPRFEPRAAHLAQSRKAYGIIWATLLLGLLVTYVGAMLALLQPRATAGAYIPIVVGLVFIFIGNYLGKLRSNATVGIRSPWTLASELSWNKTHRLGGKLMVFLGLLEIAGALFLPADGWFWLLMIGSVVLVVFLFAYSYFVWRGDSGRSTIA